MLACQRFASGKKVTRVLPASVRQWQDGGRMLSTSAGNVFVRSHSGDGPTLLLLHGFPSSSYDFRGVVDGWATAPG